MPSLREMGWLAASKLWTRDGRSEEHTSELQPLRHLVCRLLLEKRIIPIIEAMVYTLGGWMRSIQAGNPSTSKATSAKKSPSTVQNFFNDTATTEIYTLSLHDALPICGHVASFVNDGKWIGPGDRPESNRWHGALGKPHPHWVWIRFRQSARIAAAVIHRADIVDYPVDLVGEFSRDGGFTFQT